MCANAVIFANIAEKIFMYVPKMISLEPSDAKWIAEHQINLSHYVRWCLEISKDTDKRDLREVISRLRIANQKLLEIVSAYETERSIRKEDI